MDLPADVDVSSRSANRADSTLEPSDHDAVVMGVCVHPAGIQSLVRLLR
jgi:hypothetical protein